MNSLTSLVLDLQAPNLAVVAAGKQNDLMSRKIAATLRDGDVAFTPPAGVAAMIRYAKPDGTAGWYDVMEDGTTPAYSISGNVITLILCEHMLTVPGCVPVEINLYTETEKLTTFSFMLQVEKSVLTDNTIISSDYYNVLSAQIQALLGATANPPKIDPTTKNWLLWDENTGAYVDSGFSSVGTTGPQGPQGVSITTVTKASGTGAPGTTDVYDVNKSDGTVAGQFNVYNGEDGAGSPGTATPLIDSGSGVVGTSLSFSREDDQHPMPTAADVGAVSPSGLLDLVYPVGSIYLSTANTNPNVILGGTWQRITGKFLLAATDGGNSGAAQAAGNTGGEAEHTLTQSEMPAHTHGAGDPDGTRGFWRGGATARSSVQSGSNVTLVVRSPDTTVQKFDATASTGGGAAHNNMPPFLSVYVWERTA